MRVCVCTCTCACVCGVYACGCVFEDLLYYVHCVSVYIYVSMFVHESQEYLHTIVLCIVFLHVRMYICMYMEEVLLTIRMYCTVCTMVHTVCTTVHSVCALNIYSCSLQICS